MPPFSYCTDHSPPSFFYLMHIADVNSRLHGTLMCSFHSLYNRFPAAGLLGCFIFAVANTVVMNILLQVSLYTCMRTGVG